MGLLLNTSVQAWASFTAQVTCLAARGSWHGLLRNDIPRLCMSGCVASAVPATDAAHVAAVRRSVAGQRTGRWASRPQSGRAPGCAVAAAGTASAAGAAQGDASCCYPGVRHSEARDEALSLPASLVSFFCQRLDERVSSSILHLCVLLFQSGTRCEPWAVSCRPNVCFSILTSESGHLHGWATGQLQHLLFGQCGNSAKWLSCSGLALCPAECSNCARRSQRTPRRCLRSTS